MYASQTAYRFVTGAIGLVLIPSGISVIRGRILWWKSNWEWWFWFEGRAGQLAGAVLVIIGAGLVYSAITG
jgi:hypothetical protein